MYFLHRRLNISVSPLSRLICSRHSAHSAHNACAVDSPWMTGGVHSHGGYPNSWMVYKGKTSHL